MNTKKKFLSLMLIATLFLSACGGYGADENYEAPMASGANEDYSYVDNYDQYEEELTEENYDAITPGNEGLDEQLLLDRKLIKNANLSFKTDSLNVRKRIVDAAVMHFDAYVEHEEQYVSYDRENVTATIRVPAQHFDAFLEMATGGVGTFDSRTIAMDDVTEEYVDVEARIKTKKELKKRFVALLDKAETIQKIMDVEREITALQAEIESYESRLKYLSGSVKYATVNMTYYSMLEVPIEFDNKFEKAFSNGWEGLIWFFVGLTSIWPFLVILAVVFIIIRIKIRKKKTA